MTRSKVEFLLCWSFHSCCPPESDLGEYCGTDVADKGANLDASGVLVFTEA